MAEARIGKPPKLSAEDKLESIASQERFMAEARERLIKNFI
jgi:hypothetical protein